MGRSVPLLAILYGHEAVLHEPDTVPLQVLFFHIHLLLPHLPGEVVQLKLVSPPWSWLAASDPLAVLREYGYDIHCCNFGLPLWALNPSLFLIKVVQRG